MEWDRYLEEGKAAEWAGTGSCDQLWDQLFLLAISARTPAEKQVGDCTPFLANENFMSEIAPYPGRESHRERWTTVRVLTSLFWWVGEAVSGESP
jgi:hypothetical protein